MLNLLFRVFFFYNSDRITLAFRWYAKIIMASPNPNSVVLKEIDVNNAHAKLRSRKRTLVRHRGNEKRKRPNAAMQEKERLKVFNDALETLQRVIPVRLPKGRKLHKKQTLKVRNCRDLLELVILLVQSTILKHHLFERITKATTHLITITNNIRYHSSSDCFNAS